MDWGNARAIETTYKGYRFRSRLEARWAVFFDALGVEWEYEPQGFDLDGIAYLPDFWLPELGCWFEVKGNITDADTAKCRALAKATGRLVYMFGKVEPLHLENMYPEAEDEGLEVKVVGSGLYFLPDGDWDGCMTWGLCQECGAFGISLFGQHGIHRTESWAGGTGECSRTADANSAPSPRLTAAYSRAKQARFEHADRLR